MTRPRLEAGAVVVLHLVDPAEKHWGLLEELTAAGVVLRGLPLATFDDWIAALVDGDDPGPLGPSTVFFPLRRVDRLFVDETMGEAESLADRAARRLGRAIASLLT